MNVRHLGLISTYWARYAIRGGSGLVYLMVTLVFGLAAAHSLLAGVEATMQQAEKSGRQVEAEEVLDELVDATRPSVRWLLGVREDEDQTSRPRPFWVRPPADVWTAFLLDERPALLSAVFLILFFGMPFLVSFLAFNQISGDAQYLGLRYLLLRTDRASIYFGRFLGTVLFSTGVIAFLVGTIALYLGMKIRVYPTGELIAWSVYGCVALSILMVPYIAVCSMISASVDSPFLSLILCKLTIAGVLVFAVLAKLAWEPAIHIKHLLPWGWQNHLLHPDLSHSLGSVAACGGYTLVFLLAGWWRFKKRDL
ncbi:MAG: ABC transporter permease subunit [Planctomycetota bacterium]|jgi:ABC-type transport system involved in multi-copper enzyme maturation permease subunit